MNYSRFLTSISKNRKESTIREMTNLLTKASPDLVFLSSGMPNPNMFPFENATVKLRDGREIKLDSKLMATALQYGPTLGYPPLLNQLKSLTQRLHAPPRWHDTDTVVTPGSQDGLCKAIEMLINPNDYFIVQEPCYTGTLAILNPYTPRYIPVGCDAEGMIPETLLTALERWNPQEIRERQDVPKILYINPNAANPTGVSIPKERRENIYNIACHYNLLILEDDPYYFVQFDDVKNCPPSFLSLDVEGRVLRFDSFSKVLSSGIRLGYLTGPKALIRNIMLHMQASILHASSLSQVIVSELLNMWTEEGFLDHIGKLQHFYLERRNSMINAANKHLSGLCQWSIPTGGMFLWLKVPDLEDTWDMIMKRGLQKNVILVPGKAFMTNFNDSSNYMRAAFSLESPERMDLGMKYLSELIQEEIKMNQNSALQ